MHCHVRFRRESSLEVKGEAVRTALTTLGIDELEETKGGGDPNGSLADEPHNVGQSRSPGRRVLAEFLENRSADDDVHLWKYR